MKTLIAILILASFLQATILPLDLALMIIILRTYIKDDSSNLYLAFFVGLLVSHLTISPLCILSLIYLGLTKATRMLNRSRLSEHIVTVIPLVFVLFVVKELTLGFSTIVNLWPEVFVSEAKNLFIESLLALPVYLVIRFWEERFVVKDIKLRV